MNGIDWNLPDSEEAEHMVDTVSVEIVGHILETADPPLTSVLEHLVPVVCREAPVLTIGREGVRWRTGLTVEVEVARFCPHIAAITIHADRDISFEDDMMLAGIVVHGLHLCAQHKLHIIPECHLFIFFRAGLGELLAVCLIPLVVIFPL